MQNVIEYMDEREESEQFVGLYPFAVEPFQEDASGALSWGNLCNLLLRCATKHATSLGYGYSQMIERGHVWVLARLVVEIKAMPRVEESFDVATWFAGFYRQFSERMYELHSAEGRVIGRALSVWSLINTETRLAADLETIGGDTFRACTVARSADLGTPCRVRLSGTAPRYEQRVEYSDLDINGHMNSIRYLTKAMDILGYPYWQSHALRRVEMAYATEAFAGDTLYYAIAFPGEHICHIEVTRLATPNDKPELVCRMALMLAPIASNE